MIRVGFILARKADILKTDTPEYTWGYEHKKIAHVYLIMCGSILTGMV